MTIETRGLIEPKDISAIEWECSKCGARLVVRLDLLQKVPTACSRCEQDWVLYGSQEHARMQSFLVWLKEYATASNERYSMRFEVKGLTDAK